MEFCLAADARLVERLFRDISVELRILGARDLPRIDG